MRKSKYDNLIGKRFGNTTVIKRKYADMLLCRCDCGNEHVSTGNCLVNGSTKRCIACRKPSLTHDMSHTRIYKIWRGIKARCNNPNDTGYHGYGARGIKVSPKWQNSFESFYKDMKDGYEDHLVIDRIDTKGNYEPGNCRWVTQRENTRNARSNRLITIKNETKCVAEWAEVYGIKANTIITRILKYGWDEEKAVTTPIRKS